MKPCDTHFPVSLSLPQGPSSGVSPGKVYAGQQEELPRGQDQCPGGGWGWR